jgi:hypothetical protein
MVLLWFRAQQVHWLPISRSCHTSRSGKSKLTGHLRTSGIDTRRALSVDPLAALHKFEIERWWPIIKAAGIKAED